jgi:hypothetical protein
LVRAYRRRFFAFAFFFLVFFFFAFLFFAAIADLLSYRSLRPYPGDTRPPGPIAW